MVSPEPATLTPRIVAAAIRYRGFVFYLPQPARHMDVLNHARDLMGDDWAYTGDPDHPRFHDQGFIAKFGREMRYVPRDEALRIAINADQLLELAECRLGTQLMSEDVW